MRSVTRRLLVLLCCLPFAAQAAFPEHALKIIVPFAAGGNIDLTARAISNGLAAALGQPVVIENRPGAGGMLGAELVARAAPDGYTLLLASTGSLAAAPALYPKLAFDPIKDFVASRSLTQVPLVLVVNPSLHVSSLKELIALAKSKSLSMASTGNGTSNHLAGELFQRLSGTKFVHVPYKGSSQALNDLLGGQVDLMFDNLPSSLPFIKAGKLKALGVSGAARSPALPDLQTFAEAGLPAYEASTVTGIALPAATPKDILQRIDAALAKTLAAPEVRAAFVDLGASVSDLPAAGFADLMRQESAKWTKVVRDANVRLE